MLNEEVKHLIKLGNFLKGDVEALRLQLEPNTILTSKGFFRNGEKVPGLIRTLSTYWSPLQRPGGKTGKYNKLKRTCPMFGKDHGSRVHNQLEVVITCIRQAILSREPVTIPIEEPDLCVIRVLKRLKSAQVIPCFAEVPVASSKVATSADIIAYDCMEKMWVVVEVKTEYEGQDYESYQCGMKNPLTKVPDSVLFRHCLQAEASRLLLNHAYEAKVANAYVLRACSKRRGTDFYKAPKFPILEEILY
jgi:hypothetical protein